MTETEDQLLPVNGKAVHLGGEAKTLAKLSGDEETR
jgi:hypothetical protein